MLSASMMTEQCLEGNGPPHGFSFSSRQHQSLQSWAVSCKLDPCPPWPGEAKRSCILFIAGWCSQGFFWPWLGRISLAHEGLVA